MPSTSSHAAERRAAGLRRFEQWADHLDTRFRVFGVPVGWDAILGLIPGVGDAVTVIPAAAMIHAGYREGIRVRALGKMALNTGFDLLVGSVPVIGDLFDLSFKSHRRNVTVLRDEYARLDTPHHSYDMKGETI